MQSEKRVGPNPDRVHGHFLWNVTDAATASADIDGGVGDDDNDYDNGHDDINNDDSAKQNWSR